ncbi:MAG: hypothetical protein LBH05_07720 [Deferribacteraceae bacterium]|jgi:uncharacterized Zn finger protein|nr:hypothetical protein [Deferribacteraceae bacterium]
MNINNFESNIDEKILTRGKNYFAKGLVADIWCETKNHYSAVVEGNIPYDVEIHLDADEIIISHNCDCPYDWGEYCKHEVAVLFAIRENLAQGSVLKQHGERRGLRTLLLQQSKEDLVSLLCELTIKYDLREDIMYYLEDDDDLE